MSFEQTAPARPEHVATLRRAIAAFARSAGAADDAVAALELATSEAISNAVVHGFVDRPEAGTLTVSAACEDGGIRVEVRDDGSGMRPRPDSPGLGVGLPLMTNLTESLEFREAPDGGTEVVMRFAM